MTPCNSAQQERGANAPRTTEEVMSPRPIVVDRGESDVQTNQSKGPLELQDTEALTKASPDPPRDSREESKAPKTIESTARKQATLDASSNSSAVDLGASSNIFPRGQETKEALLQQPFVIAVPPSAVMVPKLQTASSTTTTKETESAPVLPLSIPAGHAPSKIGGSVVAEDPAAACTELQTEVPNTPLPLDTMPRTRGDSSSSPALSSTGEEDGGKEESSDQEHNSDHSYAAAAGQSGKSGVTPPMETASLSSDQVPTTVEVPAQPKLTMTRPSSTPHSMSKMHVELPQSMSMGVMHPIPSHLQLSPSQKSKSSNSLRRGKWTVEEEAYVARVIQDFNSGYLNAPAGTTLRSYLSDKLHCDPMRITKKFTGDACIGKRVFHPAVRCPSNTAAIDKAQAELDALERRWRRRLEMQQRESAKKAAASAAAAAAAASGRSHFHASSSQPPVVVSQSQAVGNPQHLQQNLVTRTASWLDRANAILATGQSGPSQPISQVQAPVDGSSDHAQAVRSLPTKDIEDQMKEVQRLIHEGPIIQQTTAGLPHVLDQSPSGANSPSRPPVDKRARRLSGEETSGAADAEALVGFLNSVRAAAAAGRSN